ncbi:glycoside hydrolase family 18 protein, partial [Fistulina hepatica ATCC 64428]
ISSGWYPGWSYTESPASDLSWSKYTHMAFAFATTTSDPSVLSLDDSGGGDALTSFVSAAKENNVSALLSVGGWSGSVYFSPAMEKSNRATFVQTIVGLADKYDLDGVDFDWEYPNSDGAGNQKSSSDARNFLAFLKDLRATDTGSKLILSASVAITPFNGADGEPMSDVSDFADVLDYVQIMAYDIFTTSSATVGPNAPFQDECAASDDQVGSVVSASDVWVDAGFPASQILLGVPSYGYAFVVSEEDAYNADGLLAEYPSFDASATPGGASDDDGYYDFSGMIKDALLDEAGEVMSNVSYRFDNCSHTPYIYDSKTSTMVSFDDAKSFAVKGSYIVDKGLKGFAMWETVSDYNDILLDSIRASLG